MKKLLLFLALFAFVPQLATAQDVKSPVINSPKVIAQPLTKQRKLDLLFLSAVKKGDTAATKIFLSKGADVNAKNESGNSALYLATTVGKTDLIQFLLKKGAKINQKNMNGETALAEAIGSRRASAVKILLDNGADINAKNEVGMSMLTYAAYSEAIFIIAAVEMTKTAPKKPNPYKPDKNLTIIKFLLDRGAKVDANALAIAKHLKTTLNVDSVEKLLLQAQVDSQ